MRRAHALMATALIYAVVAGLFANVAGVGSVRAAGAPAEQSAALNPLTGTYREKESKDEEIGRKVLAATARLDARERERVAKQFIRVLRAEPLFAIEQYATTLTINYPPDARVPFEADGKVRLFRIKGGGLLSLRASLEGRRLTVDFAWPDGDRTRLIYEKSPDGRTLTYTRSAANRTLPIPIAVASEYELISPRATRTFSNLLNH